MCYGKVQQLLGQMKAEKTWVENQTPENDQLPLNSGDKNHQLHDSAKKAKNRTATQTGKGSK